MIKLENVGEGRIRFAANKPMSVEVMMVDGKMFVHTEPIQAKSNVKPFDKQSDKQTKEEEFENLINSK